MGINTYLSLTAAKLVLKLIQDKCMHVFVVERGFENFKVLND